MSNLNHRYSSQSWTLDLSAQRSPLSRWTGRDMLRQESFRLSLLGAESGVAPVVWLAGDRSCFEQLYQTVESYVQQGLSQPVLASQSAFPVAPDYGEQSEATKLSNGLQSGVTRSAESSLSAESALSAQSPPPPQADKTASEAHQFSLEALGLLRHQLTYRSSDSPMRQMQLSTLQLADLLDVLDQWQQETSALPESRAGLSVVSGEVNEAPNDLKIRPSVRRDFVVPQWGRVAASVAIAGSLAGWGVYSILQGGPAQVAMESKAPAPSDAPAADDLSSGALSTEANLPGNLFSSFPSAEGPPITTQAESGLALPEPLVPPPSSDQLPSSVIFPPSGVLIPNSQASSPDLASTPVPSIFGSEDSTTDDDDDALGTTSISGLLGSDTNTGTSTDTGTSTSTSTSTDTSVITGIETGDDGLIDNAPVTPGGLIDNSQPTSISSTQGREQFIGDERFLNDGQVSPETAAGFSGSSAIAEPITPGGATVEDAPFFPPADADITAQAPSTPPAPDDLAAEIVTTPTIAQTPLDTTLDLEPLELGEPSSAAGDGDGEGGVAERQASKQLNETASSPPPAVAIASPAQTGVVKANGGASSSTDDASIPVTEPLPTNPQSQAVESYLRSNWTTPMAQKQLQYRISVSSEGKLTAVQPLPGTMKSPDFPRIGSTIGASGAVPSTLNVTVTPTGQVFVTVERESPGP